MSRYSIFVSLNHLFDHICELHIYAVTELILTELLVLIFHWFEDIISSVNRI